MTQTSQAQPQRKRAGGRTKLIVGTAIIAVVLVWLVVSNLGRSGAPYVTVSELLAQGPSDRLVRGTGVVVAGSIEWDPEQLLLRFDLTDESGTLPVLYRGPRPDLLEDGAQAVAEGKYTTSGVLEATSLLLKCPSKYAEE